MSLIRASYEAVAYPAYIHPLTNPAHLAALAQVLGVEAPDPVCARILDIGCGSGANLLAMAARWPGARFTGIDFSAPDIAAARAMATEAGLINAVFHHADLMEWEPGEDRFDFVIAYGLFSWVPDAVKERLLHLVAACLSPNGIGCVSYMTYPGCKQPEALRDLVRLRVAGLTAPDERVEGARSTLRFLQQAWQAIPGLPHAEHLVHEAGRILAKEANTLLLDDLGEERDPCYLMQFVGWAHQHGLRYLGDAEFHTMLLENLPPRTARALVAMTLDQVQTEQMIDYVVNRSFRCSLVVGSAAPVGTGMDAGAIRSLFLSPVLQPERAVKPGAVTARFKASSKARSKARGVGVETLRGATLVAFMHTLAAGPGGFTAYRHGLAQAESFLGRDFTVDEEAQLVEDLLTLFGRKALLLSAVPFTPPAALPAILQLTPLNAAMLQDRNQVATAYHNAIRLNGRELRLCRLLVAGHTLEAVQASALGLEFGPTLVPTLLALAAEGCFRSG